MGGSQQPRLEAGRRRISEYVGRLSRRIDEVEVEVEAPVALHKGKTSKPVANPISGRESASLEGERDVGHRRANGKPSTLSHRTYSHRIFAAAYARLAPVMERGPVGAARRDLLAPLTGRIVEIGAGTGENFKHYSPVVTQVMATEPDKHMARRARTAVANAATRVELVIAPAEALPFNDGTFDAAVATLVLCSVREPEVALAEIARVLKPGGSLVFFEHVRSEDSERLGRWQDRLARPWSVCGAGCRPNRRTANAIETAGFEMTEFTAQDLPGTPAIVRPHIRGEARSPQQ